VSAEAPLFWERISCGAEPRRCVDSPAAALGRICVTCASPSCPKGRRAQLLLAAFVGQPQRIACMQHERTACNKKAARSACRAYRQRPCGARCGRLARGSVRTSRRCLDWPPLTSFPVVSSPGRRWANRSLATHLLSDSGSRHWRPHGLACPAQTQHPRALVWRCDVTKKAQPPAASASCVESDHRQAPLHSSLAPAPAGHTRSRGLSCRACFAAALAPIQLRFTHHLRRDISLRLPLPVPFVAPHDPCLCLQRSCRAAARTAASPAAAPPPSGTNLPSRATSSTSAAHTTRSCTPQR
jgi:hypothetical protein